MVFVVSDDQCDEQKAIMSDHFSRKDGKFLISTSSAVMGVLAVSAWMRVLLVRHFGVL